MPSLNSTMLLGMVLCNIYQALSQPAGQLKNLPLIDTRRAFYFGFKVFEGAPLTGYSTENTDKPKSGLPGRGSGSYLVLGYELSNRWNLELVPYRIEKYQSDFSLMHSMIRNNGQTMDGENWKYSGNSGVWRMSSSQAALNYKLPVLSVNNLWISAGITLGIAQMRSPAYYAYADPYTYTIGGGILYFEVNSHYKNARIAPSEKSSLMGGLQSKICYTTGNRIDLTGGVECLFTRFRFDDIRYEYNNSNPYPGESYIKAPLNWTLNYAAVMLNVGMNYRIGRVK